MSFGVAGAAVSRLLGLTSIASRRLHSISYFAIWCCIVSLVYPLIFNAPPVFDFSWKFMVLIIPIGIFGFCAQVSRPSLFL